jgi:RNA polymerase sigma-70 factor, ECF subfamily
MRLSRDRRMAELEELYERRYRHFLNVARGITGANESAHDAVQEGFAGAIRARDSFRGEGPIEAWVWRSVVNAALKSRQPRLTEAGAEPPETTAPAEVAELAPLVAALPERQRLVVFLRYYADLDYRSIARALDVEVGTISATLGAAHRAIRKALVEAKADA